MGNYSALMRLYGNRVDRVKVRIHDVLANTAKATLFLISEREVWLPNACFRFCGGSHILVDQDMAKEKDLKSAPQLHIPDKIEPEFGQQAIEELRYGETAND